MHTSSGIKSVAAALVIAGGGALGVGTVTAAPALAASTPPQCASSQLAASIATPSGGGTAGSAHQVLELRNTSSAACTLYGYPGVSYVTGNSGRQVGAAATRTGGVKEATVLLPPGAVAEADLTEADPGAFPGCRVTATRGFRVYPPGQKGALFAAESGAACANPADKDLQVQPVIPGPGARPLASSSPSPSYQVVNEQIGVPSGYNFDVRGQDAAINTPIQAWQANTADPAQQFSVVHAPGPADSGVHQILYTPFGSLKNAEAQAAGYARTHAVQAYDANGQAKFAISSVSDQSGTQFRLRNRASTADARQDFVLAPGEDGHVMIEPTYGVPGQAPGSNAMAANDAAYGKDGSPIINWSADGQWNEEIYSHHL